MGRAPTYVFLFYWVQISTGHAPVWTSQILNSAVKWCPETLPEKFHWRFSWVSWICLARSSVYLRISHFNWSTIALSRILNWDHLENTLWTFAWTHPSKSALIPHSVAGSATKTNFEGCLYGFVWSLPELFFFFFLKHADYLTVLWTSYVIFSIALSLVLSL